MDIETILENTNKYFSDERADDISRLSKAFSKIDLGCKTDAAVKLVSLITGVDLNSKNLNVPLGIIVQCSSGTWHNRGHNVYLYKRKDGHTFFINLDTETKNEWIGLTTNKVKPPTPLTDNQKERLEAFLSS